MKAFIIIDAPHEIFPYQIKSLRMSKVEDITCVQIGKQQIEDYVVEKFKAKSMSLPQKMTYLETVDHLIYNFVLKSKEPVIIMNNQIVVQHFNIKESSMDIGKNVFVLFPDTMNELDSVANGFEKIQTLRARKIDPRSKYRYYEGGIIDMVSLQDMNRIKRDFRKFLPTIMKKDNPFDLLKRYSNEKKKFKDAGSPVRMQDEVDRIYKICAGDPENEVPPCEHFRRNKCAVCGCAINKRGLLNKIKYQTSGCPIKKW